MAKMLVTGGAGFIDSRVVELFLNRGFEVVILDDLPTGRASNINPNATFHQMDIRNPDSRKIIEAERPDCISHHAAQMDVRRSVAQVSDYPHPVSDGPAKVGEPRHIYLDATKTRNDLDWSATLNLEEGLEKTVAYFPEKEHVV